MNVNVLTIDELSDADEAEESERRYKYVWLLRMCYS